MDSESRSLSVFSVIFSEQSVIKQALGEDEKKKKKNWPAKRAERR